MATTPSQAARIRDLLVLRLQELAPGADIREGTRIWTTVIEPVFTALGTDPFETDIETFLLTRLQQEYPSLALTQSDAVVDLLVRPLQLLLESLRREIQTVRTGQSVRNVATMREADAEALAANFFVARRVGARASGVVRVFFSTPTPVSITPLVEFSTTDGRVFTPLQAETFGVDAVLSQRSNGLYYVDVPVLAQDAGVEGNVDAGAVTQVRNLLGVARVTNFEAFIGGVARETNTALLARTRRSLTERSLTTRRGILARLSELFPDVQSLEVVGFGDPEMERDVLIGTSEGAVRAAGTCFVVGPFCLMFSQFEDRGPAGSTQVQVGDTIDLNFWNLLYDLPADEAHETFTIEDILFDSRGALPNFPSVALFRLSTAPSISKSVMGMVPGVLPMVFCVVKGPGKITIGGLPGGVLDITTSRGALEVVDGEVHVGGRYDVWVRPADETVVALTAEIGPVRSSTALAEGIGAVTFGYADSARHRIQLDRSPAEVGARVGQVLVLRTGNDTGTYRIIAVDDTYLYVDVDLTTSEADLHYRLLDEAGIDAFSPMAEQVPFADYLANDLRTYVGSNRVRVGVDLGRYGVAAGQTLEIFEGPDAGVYTILGFDPALGSTAPLLNAELSSTRSNLRFRIGTASEGLDRTLVNVVPGEVRLLDSGGQDTGQRVPYALPVGAFLSDAISGTQLRSRGQNGFVLPDPGTEWRPSGDLVVSRAEFPDAMSCYSDGCLEADGFIACVTLMADGTFYLNGAFPESVQRFFSDMRGWITQTLETLQVGADAMAFVNGLSPLTFGAPADGLEVLSLTRTFSSLESVTGVTSGVTAVPTAFTYQMTVTDVVDPCAPTGLGRFRDGEIVTASLSGVAVGTATVRYTAESRYGFVVESGYLAPGCTLEGVTSGTTATLTQLAARVSYTSATGAFTDGETIRGTLSTATATLDRVVGAVMQFEIVLPGEMFDGCNNVFVALPEFDWQAELGDETTFALALEKYLTGQLTGGAPALQDAIPGDLLTVTAGGNAGSYVIAKTYNYRVGTAGAILEGTADLSRFYPVTAVVIASEFPVSPLPGLAEFFSEGTPSLAALPAAPAFPGISYDVDGVAQSPWEWAGLLIDWVLKFLVSCGFDLPQELDLDASETLKSLWQLLFTSYDVYRPSSTQTARVYFVEPTAFRAYAPVPCETTTYALSVQNPADLTGSARSLPLAGLEGVTAALYLLDSRGTRLLSGVLPLSAEEAATWSALAEILQDTLDPEQVYVTFSGTDDAYGTLTITSVESGHEARLEIAARAETDAFRWFGFQGTEGGGAATKTPSTPRESTAAPRYEVSTPTVLTLEVSYTNTTTGLSGTWLGTAVLPTGSYTYEEIATAQVENGAGAPFGSVAVTVIEDTVGSPHLRLEALPASDYELTSIAFVVPASGTDGVPDVYGSHLSATAAPYVLEAAAPPVGHTVRSFGYTVTTAAGTTTAAVTPTYAQLLSLDTYMGTVVGGDAPLAAFLNALSDLCGEPRQIQFVGGPSFSVCTLAGGTTTSLTLEAAGTDDLFARLGFDATSATGTVDVSAVARGNSTPGAAQTVTARAPIPTVFRTVQGTETVDLYAFADPMDPTTVFPPVGATGAASAEELPRDVRIEEAYEGASALVLRFGDTQYDSPILAGLRAGDRFSVHEQRRLVELSIPDHYNDRAQERVPVLRTTAGTSTVQLPTMGSPFFTFLTPMSGARGESGDAIQVGDLLFLEEGDDAGGYTVVSRLSSSELVLDRPLTTTTGGVLVSGNTAEVVRDTKTVMVPSAAATHVGRYLSLFASNYRNVDGSYAITAVDLSNPAAPIVTVDRDEDFGHDEGDVHFLIVPAPVDPPGASQGEGTTAIIGGVPFRAYRGEATTWPVVAVSTDLVRTESTITVSVLGADTVPRNGFRQPYRFERPGLLAIGTAQMAAQREGAFYYMDVPVRALHGGELANLSADVRVEPVFGTYESHGYWFDAVDPRYTFSPKEELRLRFTPTIRPSTEADSPAAEIILDGTELRVQYTTAGIVDQVQRVLLSETERILCASPLTRHFLPSYVSLDLSYVGGDAPDIVAEELRTAINSLQPTDALDVSVLEGVLHRRGINRYAHPVRLWALTHDLDRRWVLAMTTNRLTDELVDYNGTNRTTVFIASKDESATAPEEIPAGPRIRLSRTTTTAF